MKKKAMTIVSVIVTALLVLWAVYLGFQPSLESIAKERKTLESRLAHYEGLLANKDKEASAWEAKKVFLPKGRPDEAMNQWVKSLLDYASSNDVLFEKVEPEGVRDAETGKEMRVFLMFHGDISKLAGFLYHIYEMDPFARVQTLTVKREEETKNFLYEVTLGKILI